MYPRTIRPVGITLIYAILIAALVCGCSSGENPVLPGNDITRQKAEGNSSDRSRGSNHVLWGMYEFVIDTKAGTIETVPLRGVMFNANVTKFLQPPSSPINLLTTSPNPGNNISTGHIDIDVTLRHPFSGLNRWRGFDVRGIVMGDGNVPFSFDPTALRAGSDELVMENADGWTRWWNPTEFTSYETILGYTKGNKAPGNHFATATVNPYKYFTDDLGADDPVSSLNVEFRGTFSTSPGINTRRYVMHFPLDPSGKPLFRFNYAIDASWALPDESYEPEYPVEAFPAEANTQEAWLIDVDTSESTTWYINETAKGGSLNLRVEVFDWQGSGQVSGVANEVVSLLVDSPVLSSPVDLKTDGTVMPGGSYSSVWEAEILDLDLTSSGTFECWIAAESDNPENYAPQVKGDPGIWDWPDVPLRAYMRGTVEVLEYSPYDPPEVLEVSPSQGVISTTVTDLEIMGNNFQPGVMVDFSYDPGTFLSVENIEWKNQNLITCDVNCEGPLGYYDVTVTNSDTQWDTLEDGFEVIDFFKCEGSAHDWTGIENKLNGLPSNPDNRNKMAIIKTGPHAGMALHQMMQGEFGLFDPEGGAGQTPQLFIQTPGVYVMDLKTCETTGRIALLSLFDTKQLYLYDENGDEIGVFTDNFLDPANGHITCIDFDKFGGIWAVTHKWIDDVVSEWELRHYAFLEEEPYYEVVTEDTVNIDDVAFPGSGDKFGMGDIGINFYLHRAFIITANKSDGGSNKITSWDLNQSPPAFLNEILNPYPPYTRHHIFGGTGALGRMNIDSDHRFDNDIEEQCRIWAYATIFNYGSPNSIDCYMIRLDGDLNLMDEGEIYKVIYPDDFHKVPQCAVINDYEPSSAANILGHDFKSNSFVEWPAPADW